MEEIMELVQHKSQLIYDLNCVKEYMEAWEFNTYLRDTWDQMNKELQELTLKIEQFSKPPYDEIEQERIELMNKIQNCERDLIRFRQQLEEINKIMSAIRKQNNPVPG